MLPAPKTRGANVNIDHFPLSICHCSESHATTGAGFQSRRQPLIMGNRKWTMDNKPRPAQYAPSSFTSATILFMPSKLTLEGMEWSEAKM